jgi:hypothetical protein
MKKINTLLIIIVLGHMLSGCKKIETSLPSNDNIHESLSRDSNFITLVNLELDLKNIISDNITSKIIQEDSALLNYLTQFNSDYYKAWDNLKNRYGKIKEQDVKNASKSYFEQQKLFAVSENKFRSNSIKPYAKNQCTWGYDLCIAGVTAGAILCHAGCIGGTAGFGAPACVLLCGTMQVAAGAQCMKGYCDFSN